MKLNLNNVLKLTLAGFLILSLVNLIFISQNSYYTDSEIWAISMTKYLWSPSGEVMGLFIKPLFHLLIYPAYIFSKNNIDVFQYSRFIALLMTFLTLYYAYKISDFIFDSNGVYILITLLLMTSSQNLLIWLPTVRSDSFALPFLLAGFYHLLLPPRKKNTITLAFFLILALAITPKALLFVLAQIFIYFYFNWTIKPNKVFLILGVILLELLLLFFVANSSFSELTRNTSKYFVDILTSGGEIPTYLSRESFHFVFTFFRDNMLFSLIVVTSSVLALFTPKKSGTVAILKVYFYFCFSLFFLYPNKLPFFLSSFVPIFSIFSAYTLIKQAEHLGEKWHQQKRNAILFLILSLFLFTQIFSQLKTKDVVLKEQSNLEQKKVISQLEQMLPLELEYYDVLGLLPLRSPILGYLGPGQREMNDQTAKKIIAKEPKIILGSGRLIVYSEELRLWLVENYHDFGNGIFINMLALEDPSNVKLIQKIKEINYNLVQLFQFNTQP